MPAPAEAPAVQRVRCRQIADSDLDTLAGLFMARLSLHTPRITGTGFARLPRLPPSKACRASAICWKATRAWSAPCCMISSRRGAANHLQCVELVCANRPYRAHSTLLVAMATKHKDVIYLNASPAAHTWRTLKPRASSPLISAAAPFFRVALGRRPASAKTSPLTCRRHASAGSSRLGLRQPGMGKRRRYLALRLQAAPAGSRATNCR